MYHTLSRFVLSLLLVCALLAGCKKEEEDQIQPTGFWRGLYGSGSSSPSQSYGVLFRNDGTLRVYAQFADTSSGSKAEGTYSINRSQLIMHYTYFTGRITGSFSGEADVNENEDMQGTYGSGNSTTGGGTFWLSKE